MSATPNADNDNTAMLSGNVDDNGNIEVGKNLILKINISDNDNYHNWQQGTLYKLGEMGMYKAEATVKITSIEGYEIKTSQAVFQSKQTIVKFTLNNISESYLDHVKITVGGTTSYIVYTIDKEFYVAMDGFENKTVKLEVEADHVSGYDYTYTKENVTFENGKFYTRTVNL